MLPKACQDMFPVTQQLADISYFRASVTPWCAHSVWERMVAGGGTQSIDYLLRNEELDLQILRDY